MTRLFTTLVLALLVGPFSLAPPVQAQNARIAGDTVTLTSDDGTEIRLPLSGDGDFDGISNEMELFGFYYDVTSNALLPCDPATDVPCYQTDPLRYSTDGDPYGDLQEASGINMPASIARPYSHPLVPARPIVTAQLVEYYIDPIGTITDSNGGSQSEEFGVETSVEIQVGGSTKVGAQVGTSGINGSTETEANWSVTAGFGFSSSFASSVDWSQARTSEPDRAALLRLSYFLENMGSARANNVTPTFNVLIGDEVIGTITPGMPILLLSQAGSANARFPAGGGTILYPENTSQAPFELTLRQLKALEGGAPLTLRLLQVQAQVPRWDPEEFTWECPGTCSWNDFVEEIDAVSTRLHVHLGARHAQGQSGDERLDFQVFARTENYIPGLTLGDALEMLDPALDVEEGGTLIEGRPYPESWYLTSPSALFIEAWEDAGAPASLLDVPIHNGDRVDLVSPGDDPGADINLATFSDDFRQVFVSAWPAGGFSIISATARVTIDGIERDVQLHRPPGELFYRNALPFDAPASALGEITVTNALGPASARTVSIDAPFPLNASCDGILDELIEMGIEPEDGVYVVFPDPTHPERPAEAYCRFSEESAETFFWIERETGRESVAAGLYGAAWTSDTTAFVVGDRTLLYSDDVGRTWTAVELASETQAVLDETVLWDVSIRPDGVGLAVGETGETESSCVVLRTVTGGESWASIGSACGGASTLQSVAHAEGRIWVAVGGDRIMRSTDDGASWTPAALSNVSIRSMGDVAFGNDGAGMATDSWNDIEGAGQVLFTRDAGSTWQRLGTFTRVRAVDHLDDGVFAVSGRGVFVRANVDSTAWFVRGIAGAADLQDVAFPTPEIGFAVDGTAKLYRTQDGGTTWNTAEPAMHGQALRRLAMRNANRGLATGVRGRVLQTTSGGGTPVDVPVVVAQETGPPGSPATFSLDSAYPNPFRGQATIAYTLGTPGDVALTVYDVLGRQVARLVEGPRPVGAHTAPFDGRRLAPGVYVVRLLVGDRAETRRMTLLR